MRLSLEGGVRRALATEKIRVNEHVSMKDNEVRDGRVRTLVLSRTWLKRGFGKESGSEGGF